MSKFNAGKKRDGRNKAVALRYRPDDNSAPVIVASGYGQIADKIIGIAEQKGIPVYKDDSAASMLCMLEVGRDIPPDLYEVVAAIYMQILNISKKIKHSGGEEPKGVSGQNAARELREQLAAADGNR